MVVVDQSLRERNAMIRLLRANLIQAQARMKGYVDKRSERTFEAGDKVFLCLQPYKQTTVAFKGNRKLSPQFFGPYKVLQRVGQVAYKLELFVDSKIHHIFHVSSLKKKLGESIIPELPTTRQNGQLQLEPVSILDRRVFKRNHGPKTPGKMQSKDNNSFLCFSLEDEACLKRSEL